MSLSDRPSRVIRGGAHWKPLRMAALDGRSGQADTDQSDEHVRQTDVEARVAAAFRDGVIEGRFQAQSEAQAHEQTLGQSAGQRWDVLLSHLGAGIAEVESAMADRLLDLSAVLAARIACRDIALSQERIGPVLADVLALLTSSARRLEVTAHPSDCHAIETWLRPRCGETSLTVRADASLAPGGCVLRADDTVLDATLQTRIVRTLAAVGIEDAQARSIGDSAIREQFGIEAARVDATDGTDSNPGTTT